MALSGPPVPSGRAKAADRVDAPPTDLGHPVLPMPTPRDHHQRPSSDLLRTAHLRHIGEAIPVPGIRHRPGAAVSRPCRLDKGSFAETYLQLPPALADPTGVASPTVSCSQSCRVDRLARTPEKYPSRREVVVAWLECVTQRRDTVNMQTPQEVHYPLAALTEIAGVTEVIAS